MALPVGPDLSTNPAPDPQRRKIAASAEAAWDFQRSHVGRRDESSLAHRIRVPMASVAKRMARTCGLLTANRRAEPSFLMIGAKRAGSTTLHRGVVEAGGVAPMFPAFEQRKGMYFFDVHHQQGRRWYMSHMPTRSSLERDGLIVGESTPYYLSHPHAAARAAEMLPDAKIVAVLRDPIERAHSHYGERFKQGIEYLPTFEDAIAAEPERLAGELERMLEDPTYRSWNHLNFGYIDQSRYATSLGRWLDAFPSEQVLVLRAEDLYENSSQVINQTREFLGLKRVADRVVEHHNKLEKAPLSSGVQQFLAAQLGPEIQQLETRLNTSFDWAIGK
ncbi:MAG: hypothetical protein ACI8Y4_002860 [Candidatus Poriferisodalaceae bacterium]|jgi:hypothetical protein